MHTAGSAGISPVTPRIGLGTLTSADLESRIKTCCPHALGVEDSQMRRAVREDRGIAQVRTFVPHTHVYALPRSTLSAAIRAEDDVEFELPVVLQNQTDKPLDVQLALRATNASLTAGIGRTVTVPANDRVEVRLPMAAAKPGMARMQSAPGGNDDRIGGAWDGGDLGRSRYYWWWSMSIGKTKHRPVT